MSGDAWGLLYLAIGVGYNALVTVWMRADPDHVRSGSDWLFLMVFPLALVWPLGICSVVHDLWHLYRRRDRDWAELESAH